MVNLNKIEYIPLQKTTISDNVFNDEDEIKELKTSQAAIDFLKDKEKLELEAYDDGAGNWTIGYGHTGRSSGVTVKEGMIITEEEAEKLLVQDLQEFEQNVYNRMVNYNTPLSQREFDYLIIATFNRGNDIVGKSLYEAVSKRDRNTITKLMAKTIAESDPNVMAGLKNRLVDEEEFLFDYSQYIPTTTTLGPLFPTTTTTTVPGTSTSGQSFNYVRKADVKPDKKKLDSFLETLTNLGIQFQDAIDNALGVEKGKPVPKYGYLGEKLKMKLDEWNK